MIMGPLDCYLKCIFDNIDKYGLSSIKDKIKLTPDNDRQVIGSTQLHADQIMVLGSSVFLPNDENGDSAIFEIDINDKKMRVYRGYKNNLIRSGIT
jgi:hypothetical protein